MRLVENIYSDELIDTYIATTGSNEELTGNQNEPRIVGILILTLNITLVKDHRPETKRCFKWA